MQEGNGEAPVAETPVVGAPETNPPVSGDAAPEGVTPKKKSLVVPIVIATVVAVVAIGVAVAMIILTNQKSQEAQKDSEPDVNAIARNRRRENALDLVAYSVNTYQTNNSGRVPFKDGEVDSKFISRYVDPKCVTTNGLSYTGCSDGFKDPSGKIYGFAKPVKLSADLKPALMDVETLDYKFHPYVFARCGKENEVKYVANERSMAILYKGDGSKVLCADNY